MLSSSAFFQSTDFPHNALFDSDSPVWSALKALPEYVTQFAHIGVEPSAWPQVYFIHPELITIGKGCIIAPGACIEGPCIIGDEVVIRHGAYLRSGSIMGDRTVLGHGSELVRSILFESAKIPHLSYVGDSILGRNVNLGAGAICSNLRLDKALIRVFVNGSGIETGLHKLGAIIGDNVSVGCHVVMNPGTLIYPGAKIAPGIVIKGEQR